MSAQAQIAPPASGPFTVRDPAEIEQPVLRLLAERIRAGGRQPGDDTRLALGIEGGGLATSMCAGMAWALEQLGATDAFDAIYGVSSGGLIAAYATARRMEAAIDLLPQTCTREFVDVRRIVGPRPVLSLDHLFTLVRNHPLGHELLSGEPDLRLSPRCSTTASAHARGFADSEELLLALRACCAIPVISRETVALRGHELSDGGLVEWVPFHTLLREEITHVLALRSRDAGYRKGRRGRLYGVAEDRVINRLPGRLADMIRARPALYDAHADELAAAAAGEGPLAGRVMQLAPALGTPSSAAWRPIRRRSTPRCARARTSCSMRSRTSASARRRRSEELRRRAGSGARRAAPGARPRRGPGASPRACGTAARRVPAAPP